jgi:hypothetical protein
MRRRDFLGATGLVLAAPVIVRAQPQPKSLPDFPKFLIDARVRVGDPIEHKTAQSNQFGIIDLLLGVGWFHNFSLQIIENDFVGKLQFHYKCAYELNNFTVGTCPTRDEPENCPFADPNAIMRVRAILIRKLSGDFADRYDFTYGGVVTNIYHQQKSYDNLGPEQWLGDGQGTAGGEWVSKLTMKLVKN